MTAGPAFRIKSFNGREIAYQGVAFEGSPRHVFWSRYIEPFLEHLYISEIEAAVSMCHERYVDAKLLLPEVQDLLTAGVKKVFENMAEVDQRLRGKGYPEKINRQSVANYIQRMEAFVTERIRAELDMWEARESSTQNAQFGKIAILEHQKSLLLELVKADHSVALEHKGHFVVSEAMTVRHLWSTLAYQED